MPAKKRARTLCLEQLEELTAQGDVQAKKELARRLLEGEGVDKNEKKAVRLLEDCAVSGDPDAMLMLAKCFIYGDWIEQDTERAETLLRGSARGGNKEATSLVELIDFWKELEEIDLTRSFLSPFFITWHSIYAL